jgi:alpha-D-ribose 1-methylphosphonate 5-triphosphate synthase subunit PhnG
MDPTLPRSTRQSWLATLAHAPRESLRAHADRTIDDATSAALTWLREPEVGLAMIRARVDGSGDAFNLGETTLTRCVARYRAGDGTVSVGVGYVKGRDPERARWVATFDALLQQPARQASLLRDVIEPLRDAVAARRADERSRTATSRVRFFTMQAEAT